MKKYANYRTIPSLVANRQDFEGNTMSGQNVKPGSHWNSGHLNSGERDLFFATTDITYIVRSYATPIAWYSESRGWHKVNQKFSVTTSKHQGKLYLV